GDGSPVHLTAVAGPEATAFASLKAIGEVVRVEAGEAVIDGDGPNLVERERGGQIVGGAGGVGAQQRRHLGAAARGGEPGEERSGQDHLVDPRDLLHPTAIYPAPFRILAQER